MRKLAPFIPIVGFFLTPYYMINKWQETGIEDYGIIFWSSALIQSASVIFMIFLFTTKC